MKKQNLIIYNKKHVVKSIFYILGILLLGSVMVYGLNTQLSRTAYFLIVLAFLLRSKDKVLVTVILFVLMLYPDKMFYSPPYNWILQVSSTVGLVYFYAFSIAFFIKYLYSIRFRRYLIKDYFTPFYRIFVIYLLFLIIIGFTYGNDMRSYYFLITSFSGILLFFVFTRMLNAEEILQFNRIIFVWAIIMSFVAVGEILLKGQILQTLVFGRPTRTHLIFDSTGLMRIGVGLRLMYYSASISIYYLIIRKKEFKAGYLWVVILLSSLSIINGATRGWMLGLGFVIIVSILFYLKNLLTSKVLFSAIILTFFLIIFLPSKYKENLKYGLERFSTLESVAEGDITAQGTVSRFTERGPKALTRFNESPIFGFGFSKVSAQYFDHHVGNHSVLITSGILGLIIIWLTAIGMVFYIFKLEIKYSSLRGIFVFGIIIMSMMLIHSTNEIMISFWDTPTDAIILWVLFLNNINARIDSRNKVQKSLQNTHK